MTISHDGDNNDVLEKAREISIEKKTWLLQVIMYLQHQYEYSCFRIDDDDTDTFITPMLHPNEHYGCSPCYSDSAS